MSNTPLILGIVAGVIAVIAVSLKAYAITLYEFVDVHAIADVDDASGDNRVGGLGVFRAEFTSANTPDQAAVLAAQLPLLDIETPSTSFPLLFPAQENFIATQLPLSSENLPAFEAQFGNNIDFTTNLEPSISGLEGLELDDCQQYVQTTETLLQDYMGVFIREAIPNASAAIMSQLADPALIGGAEATIGLHGGNTIVLTTAGFFGGVGDGVQQLIGVCDFDTITINTDPANCFPALFGQAPISANDVSEVFGSLVSDIVIQISDTDANICGDVTLGACIVAVLNFAPVLDIDVSGAPQFQGAFTCQGVFCDGSDTHFDLLLKLSDLYPSIIGIIITAGQTSAEDIAALEAGAAAVPLLINGGAFNITLETLTDNFAAAPAVTDLQLLDTDSWSDGNVISGVCTFLDAVSRVISIAPTATQQFAPSDNDCNFNTFLNADFLGGILLTAGNTAAGQVIALSALVAAPPNTPLALVFLPRVFINRGFGSLIVNEGTLFQDSIIEPATDECNDDKVDKDYIGHGQGFVISSMFFQLTAVILIVAGVIGFARGPAFTAAAVFGILSGICTIGGLLIVAAAPVYDGVGEEPVGVEATFIRGVVPTLALVEAVFMMIAGIMLIVGVCIHAKSGKAGAYEEAVEAKEVKQAVPQQGAVEDMESKL